MFKRGNTYVVKWRDKGVQRQKSFKRKALAQKFESELTLGLVAEDERVNLGRESFTDFARRWLQDYCKIENSESQQRGAESIIRVHLVPAFGHKSLRDISQHDLLGLRGRLKTKNYLSVKSINNICMQAKKILQTAVDWEVIHANPFAKVKPLKLPEQPFDYWTPEERDRYLGYVKSEDPDHWEVVAFTCHTGMRLGEVQGLKRECIDFDRRLITVKEQFNVNLQKFQPTKGKNIRHIPMNEVTYQILLSRRLIAPSELIFPRPIRHTVRGIKKWAHKAGVKAIRYHDLRHTFASCLAMAGVPLVVIQTVLGHADIRETQRYSHLAPGHLNGVTDLLVTGGGKTVAEQIPPTLTIRSS